MNTEVEELKQICRYVRKSIINTIAYAGAGHTGGSLSEVEILVALYFRIMKIDPQNPALPERDRFILYPPRARVSFPLVMARPSPILIMPYVSAVAGVVFMAPISAFMLLSTCFMPAMVLVIQVSFTMVPTSDNEGGQANPYGKTDQVFSVPFEDAENTAFVVT